MRLLCSIQGVVDAKTRVFIHTYIHIYIYTYMQNIRSLSPNLQFQNRVTILEHNLVQGNTIKELYILFEERSPLN